MGKLEKDPDMEVLYQKAKKKQRHQEAGHGKNGEPSEEALRRWFIWAGAALVICLAVVLTGGMLTSGKNKKEAAVLELDAGPVVELVLNRKGMLLGAEGKNGAGSLLLAGLDLDRAGLEQGLDLLIGGLCENGAGEERKTIVLTVRPYAQEHGINVSRMAEQAVLYAEKALKKRQTGAVIYYDVFQETSSLEGLMDQYQISYGKAGLVKGLVDKNTKLKLDDQGRLAKKDLQEIAKEIENNKYAVSYESVTVKTSYQEKDGKGRETKKSTEAETPEETAENTVENTGENAQAESSGEETSAVVKETPAATKAPETTAAPETAAPETAASETASPETAAPETASPETAAPVTPAPVPETPAPEAPAPAPETEAPAPIPPVSETVNPAGPGFNPGVQETVPEVKSPLAGPGA